MICFIKNATLHTLFLSLKIVIFSRIAPIDATENAPQNLQVSEQILVTISFYLVLTPPRSHLCVDKIRSRPSRG